MWRPGAIYRRGLQFLPPAASIFCGSFSLFQGARCVLLEREKERHWEASRGVVVQSALEFHPRRAFFHPSGYFLRLQFEYPHSSSPNVHVATAKIRLTRDWWGGGKRHSSSPSSLQDIPPGVLSFWRRYVSGSSIFVKADPKDARRVEPLFKKEGKEEGKEEEVPGEEEKRSASSDDNVVPLAIDLEGLGRVLHGGRAWWMVCVGGLLVAVGGMHVAALLLRGGPHNIMTTAAATAGRGRGGSI